jgi:hypothetical protein
LATPALADPRKSDKGKNDDKSFQQLSQRNNDNDHKDKDKVKTWDSDFKLNDRHNEYQGEVTSVPEPETYAMMLAGLAAVGFVVRRRKT